MGKDMNVTVSREEKAMIVTVVGRLDSITSCELEDWTDANLALPESDLLMECSQLDYISSAGLRAILKISRLITTGSHTFSLCNVQDHVKEVFEISGFDSFIPIFKSVKDALAE